MLSIEHLSFSYGSSPVLSDVSFNVADGENTVILGVNGEGKTTLLRCICGVLHPLSGKICLDGKDITFAKAFERARRIAYVPQLQRISSLTVFDTVLSGRRGAYSFLPGKSDRKRTGSIIEQLGIADIAAKKTYELSGGEIRKVSVARALCSDAKLILMDEPTANLDIARRFFHPAEYRQLCEAPSEKRNHLFYRFWTLKESYMKMTGEGFHLSPSDFRIGIGEEDIFLEREGIYEAYHFAELSLLPSYCCSVCTEGTLPEPNVKSLDLRSVIRQLAKNRQKTDR